MYQEDSIKRSERLAFQVFIQDGIAASATPKTIISDIVLSLLFSRFIAIIF